MSSWLTFVIGVIVGLLAGWLIDLLYHRRTETAIDVEGESTEVLEAPVVPEVPATATPEPVDGEASEEPAWPAVAARVAEVADEAEAAPPDVPEMGDESPAAPEALPPEAVEALAPAAAAAGTAELAAAPGEAGDKLTAIEGIGPTYEARLRAAGVNTFAQLAETSPQQLGEIIQPQGWQRVNFSEWIEQARLIAEGKDDELKALQSQLFGRK